MIWSSAILFVWLLVVVAVNFIYKPAQQGRKAAYLMVSSFLFLVLELVLVWVVGHATGEADTTSAEIKRNMEMPIAVQVTASQPCDALSATVDFRFGRQG